ncbi:hypothetical protein AVEN_226994-1 [Araneus ventricosus]|uniref:Uncharacterized protein n=1 Tax=Araneus ventricosus TaxID=182803 RepID=A0A4Y2VQM1_ARAVE|nr:hypothetical protein AVEN_226994-1 [Araneus ventricosus]
METEYEQRNCRNYSLNAVNFLISRVARKASLASGDEHTFSEVYNEMMHCLMNLFHINCFIIKSTTACDSGVKQPILEIIEKGGRLDDQCPNSSRIDVLELLDAMKLVSPEEIHSKELIRVNSFFKG